MKPSERDEILIRLDQKVTEMHADMGEMKVDISVTKSQAQTTSTELAVHTHNDTREFSWLRRGMLGIYAFLGVLLASGIAWAVFK